MLAVHKSGVKEARLKPQQQRWRRLCFHGYGRSGGWPAAGAHLRQPGLFVADFVLADGRQLLQRVAVVGQRSRQPCKLGPPCKSETEKSRFTNTDTSRDVWMMQRRKSP